MLTEAEKAEARMLLDKLPTEDIEALTETVSSRMVTADTRQTGVDAILMYSESAKQLLRRKKVKREHIVMYLAEKNQQASHTEDKTSLVKRVLDYWEKNNISNPGGDDGRGDPNMIGGQGQGGNIVEDYMRFGGHIQLPRTESPTFHSAVDSLNPLQVGVTPEGMAVCKDDDGQRLAENFAPWFYSMLKSSAVPTFGDLKPGGQTRWGPHHFWPDAKLQIFELPEGGETRVAGADAISDQLALLVTNGFVLDPNLVTDGGVKGMLTVNNVISVSVGGKFSRMTQEYCSDGGTFEQSFSLFQDKQSNNWRIKATTLKLMWVGGEDPNEVPEFPFLHARPTADMPNMT